MSPFSHHLGSASWIVKEHKIGHGWKEREEASPGIISKCIEVCSEAIDSHPCSKLCLIKVHPDVEMWNMGWKSMHLVIAPNQQLLPMNLWKATLQMENEFGGDTKQFIHRDFYVDTGLWRCHQQMQPLIYWKQHKVCLPSPTWDGIK